MRIVDWACGELARLHAAAGVDGEPLEAALREGLACLADRRVDDIPVASTLFLNLMPFSLSVAFGPRAAEVRFEIETQTIPPTLSGFNREARALLERLDRTGAHEAARFLRLWERVGRDRLAHFGARSTSGVVGWKAYVTPHYRFTEPLSNWDTALEELGLLRAVEQLRNFVRASRWHFASFGCALAAGDDEVEIYLAPPWRATLSPADVEALAANADKHVPGDFTGFVGEMLGSRARGVRPPGTPLISFVADATGLHTPCYFIPLPGDLEVAERVRATFGRFGIDAAAYDRALAALSNGAMAERSLHHLVSFRRKNGEPRITVYFTPTIDARVGRGAGATPLVVTTA